MEDRKEKNAPWLSVPQFGDWDQKGQVPDYSMDFSKIREMRKQNKNNVSRASIGNEDDLMASSTASINTGHSITEPQHAHYHRSHHAQSSPQRCGCIPRNRPCHLQGGASSATSTVA